MPVVAGAVAAGRVPVAHLDVLARASAHAGGRAVAALGTAVEQERVVRLAERLSVREFGGAVTRLVASYDPQSLERGLVAQKKARFLLLSHQPDGVHLRGRLDVLAGAKLRCAGRGRDRPGRDAGQGAGGRRRAGRVGRARHLGHGRCAPPPRGHRRSRGADVEQDAADARVLGVANRQVVSILIAAETLLEIQARRRPWGAASTGRVAEDARTVDDAAAVSDLAEACDEPVEPATLEDGTPLALSQVAQSLCDCQLGRIVLGADSVPLDLGRTTRLFSAAQRRAVILRDRACAWNGCEVPAGYSEIHHLRWWDRDEGSSDYDNAVLLCSHHHHHVVHQHDLTMTRRPGSDDPGGGSSMPDRGPRPSGGLRDEPVRYEFSDRRGALVSAPTRTVEAALPSGVGPRGPSDRAAGGRASRDAVPARRRCGRRSVALPGLDGARRPNEIARGARIRRGRAAPQLRGRHLAVRKPEGGAVGGPGRVRCHGRALLRAPRVVARCAADRARVVPGRSFPHCLGMWTAEHETFGRRFPAGRRRTTRAEQRQPCHRRRLPARRGRAAGRCPTASAPTAAPRWRPLGDGLAAVPRAGSDVRDAALVLAEQR